MDSLQQIRLVVDAAPGAPFIADAHGRIVHTNQAMDDLFGYEPGELAGQMVEVLVPDEVRAFHAELRDAYVEMPYNRAMGSDRALRGKTRDGRLVPIEIGLNTVNEGGELFVVASVVDVSERVGNVQKTQLMLNAAATAMLMIDAGGAITMANEQAGIYFGYPEADLIGSPVEMLLPAALRRRHAVYRTSFAANPHPRAMGGTRELYARRRDGSEFPVEIALTPIDDNGETSVVATIIDVTERKAAEREIREKNDDLSRLNEELNRFAYSASHDLKAPLVTLQGLLSCIEEDSTEGEIEEVRANAARARGIAGELAGLIEGLLGFAKSESFAEEWRPVRVRELVDKSVDKLRATIDEHDVRVAIDVAQDLVVGTAPTRLAQIIDNLIGNAAKFADLAKDERWIRVSVLDEDGQIGIRVEDNGIGIPEKNHDDVFKMFKRFGNHQRSGSGLGLALVRQHVEKLSGSIDFASTPQGSRFDIRVPSIERVAHDAA